VLAAPAAVAAPEAWHHAAAALCLMPPYEAAATQARAELRDLLAALDAWGEPPGALTAPPRRSAATTGRPPRGGSTKSTWG
jgi:hypothetical protein